MVTINNVDDLENSIQAIVVKDYGDFKRKAITYINRFDENNALGDEQKKQVTFLKWYIQFHPNHQLTETKQWTLDQIQKLRP